MLGMYLVERNTKLNLKKRVSHAAYYPVSDLLARVTNTTQKHRYRRIHR